MPAIAADGELVDFVYAEARLIDEKRLEEWYELFAEDACYWVPLTRGQRSGRTENSLFFEDKLLLKLRIARLRNPHAYSQDQTSWCQHVLQAPEIEAADPGRILTRTPFHYAEARGDAMLLLAGVARHELIIVDGAPRIRLKRIDLVNCDAALPSIQLFL